MSVGPLVQSDGQQGLSPASAQYHEKLQSELSNKKDVAEAAKAEKKHDLFANKQTHIDPPKPAYEGLNFKDELVLSSMEWEGALDKKGDNKDLRFRDKMINELKGNGEKLRRHLGQKIDFSKRLPQLKEMFKFNLIRSRSHNQYLSRFAQFKVGVVGQILSSMGVPIDDLKNLKKSALKEAYETNKEDMSENVYAQEVADLMLGGDKAKRTIEMCAEMQVQLTQRMNQIGPVGYWSTVRVLEEKITQCQKIIDEFQKEKSVLEYQVDYREQVSQ